MSAVARLEPTQCLLCEAPSDGAPYCCQGCRTVHALLVSEGLDNERRVIRGSAPPSAKARRTYTELDDATFQREHVRELADGLSSVNLTLEGIHCSACLWILEKLPRMQPGVVSARLDSARSSLHVVYRAADVKLSVIACTLRRLGYSPHPAAPAARQDARRREDRALLVRMAVAGASAGNIMLLAVALYAGESSGMEPGVTTFLRWASLVVTLPAMVYSSDVFFRGALSSLRTRTAHIDLPLAISLFAGFIHGAVNTVRNEGPIYFDSVVALVFALLASRYLHRKKQRAATDATEALQTLTPTLAHRVASDGSVSDIPAASLVAGDVVEVQPDERFPADGCVVAGASTVDQSLLTGESQPVDVAVGGRVAAGTVNMTTVVRVVSEEVGPATRIAKLMQEAQAAFSARAPVIQLANRLAGFFVVAAMVLSVLTVVFWWSHGLERAFGNAIALLIVTCPCALGLATPLAMSTAMGRAASSRLLIKSSDALERLAKAQIVIFDKTGTLTTGVMTVAHWFGALDVQPLVGALERSSRHPIGRALAKAFDNGDAAIESVEQQRGCGVVGRVSGRAVAVGSLSWIAETVIVNDIWHGVAQDLARSGASPVAVAVDGEVVAIAGITDCVRSGSREVVERLLAMGVDVQLLSGDDRRVVASTAAALGIRRFEGGATPERKLAAVRELGKYSSVVMVGDGANDAAALAAASVGVAVHGGAEASLAAADVYVNRPGVDSIAELIQGARRTMSIIRTGFACGLVYNIVGVTLAMTGLVSPLLAAIIMPASSLTVVTLAYRRRSFDGSRA